MNKIIFHVLFSLFFIKLHAQPGKDGPLTISASTQIVNHYSPLSASISVGSNTLSVASSPIIDLCQGDLIMVYQAQGASIDLTNTPAYGNITSYNSAGLYEFKYVQSVSGNIITTQGTFTNSYVLAGRPQVIKVPQYTTLTINAGCSIIPKPWKDTTIALVPYRFGGLVVIHTANIVNNGTITSSGKGFRGGQLSNLGYLTGITDYVSNQGNRGGEKGEGIFGYQVDYDNNNGRYCRGAGANGGGGGNSTNSSGGGGANGFNGNAWTGQGVMIVDAGNPLAAWALDPGYISNANALTTSSGGGRGGYSWSNNNGNALINAPGTVVWAGDLRREVGGIGGRPLTNIDAETRIYFGGGGGSGHENDNAGTAGSNGGGIVYLIATVNITGTGVIESNGLSVPITPTCSCDGTGGAGAGGSIVIKTPAIAATQNIAVNGGNGGSQLMPSFAGNPFESESGAGGGGGGFSAISAIGVVPTVNGGANGTTLSAGLTEFPYNGATQGATGQTATVSNSFINYSSTNTVTSNSPVCSGGTLSFSCSPAVLYIWSGPAGFSAVSQNPSIANTTTLMSGTYSVISYFNGAGTCPTSITQTIDVQINLSSTLSIVSATNCTGNTTLIVSGSNTYTWNPGTVTGNSLAVNMAPGTVYSVTGTSTTGCVNNASYTLTAPPPLTISVAPSSPTACTGNSITLTASGSGGTPGYNYTWTAGPASSNYTISNIAGSYIYTVNGTDANNCSSTKTISIDFIGQPTLSVNSAGICSGTSGTLTASGASSFTWNPSGFIGNPFIASPVSNTVYTLTGSASGCTANASATITVNQLPVLSITNNTICPGGTGTLTVAGASSYTWQPGSVINNTYTASPPATSVYSVTGTSSLSCTGFATATITVPPTLSLNVSANSATACVYNSIILTANNSGGTPGYTYTWTGGPANSTYTVNNNAAGAYVYTVNSNDANNCLSAKTISVSFIAQPTITVSNATICSGSSGTLTAAGASNYTWNPTGFTVNSFTASPASNSVYSVTGSANNCTASATATITVNPVPVLSFVTASITCASLGTATVNASGAIGPYSYSWSPSAQTTSIATSLYPGTYTLSVFDLGTSCTSTSTTVFTSTVPFTGTVTATSSLICNGVNTATAAITLSGGSGSQVYSWSDPAGVQTTSTATGLSAGTHTIIVSDGITFCTVVDTFQITQPPAVTVNIAASSPSACVGSDINLNASASGGFPTYTYSWAAGPSTYSNSITQNQPGTYFYFVSSSDSYGCIGTGSTSLIFAAYPTLSVNSISICIGNTGTLTATGANSYTWFPGTILSSTLGVSPLATSSFSVFGNTAGCISNTTVAVIVNPLPIAVINSNNNICEGSSINLTTSGNGVYSWTGPEGFISVNQNTVINMATLNNAGVYNLTVIDNKGCVASTSKLITVLTNPVISAAGAYVCIGEAATLSASGGVSYNWNGPGGATYNSAEAYVPVVTNNNTGQYTVNVTGVNACVSSTVVPLVGFPFPLPIPSINTGTKACINSTISLKGSGGGSYLWHGPPDLVSNQQDLNLTMSQLDMGGIYTLTVRNNSNCAASATVLVSVYPLPTATPVSSHEKMCVPFCSDITLNAAGTNPAPIKGFYLTGQGGFYSNDPKTLCFEKGGIWAVKVNYADTNGCVNTSMLTVSAYSKPLADFTFSPAEPQAAIDPVQFNNFTTNTTQHETWSWFFESDINVSKEKNPSHIFESPGTYPVVLVAENEWGCADTVIKPITVIDEVTFYVPDAFTPNGDGLNDLFQPKGIGLAAYQYKLDIFDRWGERLFSTTDFLKGWDGSYKDNLCATGIYVWKIEITSPKKKAKFYQGFIYIEL